MVILQRDGEHVFLRGGRPTRHVATYTWHETRNIMEFNGVEIPFKSFVHELHHLAHRYDDSYDTIVVRCI